MPLPDAPPPDYDAPQTPAVEGPPASAPSPAPAAQELHRFCGAGRWRPRARDSRPAGPGNSLARPAGAPPAGFGGALRRPRPPPSCPWRLRPAPAVTPFLDEASFAARLEEASFETDARLAELEPEPEPEPELLPRAPGRPVVHRL